MSTQILKTSTQTAQQVEPVQALDVEADVSATSGKNRIPLTVRSRRVLRMAPPIDDGFRPFRVF